MGRNVFANGREISAKADDNKSLCAMPDICLSPPSPPAGPIPIPYPNTAVASDTSDGSKTVKIGGKEVGLKNKSNYKTSKGDEAATRSLGMGIVTHTIQGKMKHAAWSMDVTIEGENAIRHLDLTTHNHINNPNIAIQLNQGSQNVVITTQLTCEELKTRNSSIQSNDLKPSATRPDVAYTSTTASYTPSPAGAAGTGATGSYMKAVTKNDLIQSGKTSGFAKPRPDNQTIACSSVQWGAGGNNNHTEPKIIEQIFDAARASGVPLSGPPGSLGTLKMFVNHQDSVPSGSPPGTPRQAADNEICPRCQKGICKAVECGLEIKLCEGDPVQEKDAGEKCQKGEFQKL